MTKMQVSAALIPSGGSKGEPPPAPPSPSFRCSSQTLGVPWLVDVSPVSASAVTGHAPRVGSLCLHMAFTRTPVMLE